MSDPNEVLPPASDPSADAPQAAGGIDHGILGYAGTHTMPVYDNSSRAHTAALMLLIYAGLSLLQTLVQGVFIFTFKGFAGPMDQPDFGMGIGGLIVQGCIGFIAFGVYVVAIVFYMMWQYRAFSNLRAIGRQTLFSPGWSVGWWFIPFVNLVMPLLILRDLWNHSAPSAGGSRPVVAYLLWISGIGLAITAGILGGIAGFRQDETLYRWSLGIGVVSGVLFSGFFLWMALFVKKVQNQQPQPAAWAHPA